MIPDALFKNLAGRLSYTCRIKVCVSVYLYLYTAIGTYNKLYEYIATVDMLSSYM